MIHCSSTHNLKVKGYLQQCCLQGQNQPKQDVSKKVLKQKKMCNVNILAQLVNTHLFTELLERENVYRHYEVGVPLQENQINKVWQAKAQINLCTYRV